MKLLAAPSAILALFSFAGVAAAHSDHAQQVLADDADWATRHMAEEHHINNFDAGSFFNMHDYDGTGQWSPEDVKRTYGLFDESNANLLESRKDEVAQKIMELYDTDKSGTVSLAEFTAGNAKGVKLPDFGHGPGHHGDDEYEYEIHHFERYHDENTKEEDLVHPEDIAHFRKHDMEDAMAELQAKRDKMPIVEENIPAKFRRGG